MASFQIKNFVGGNSYTIYVPLLNFAANGENLFQDLASNTLLNPANSSQHVVIRAIETFTASQLAFDDSQRPIVSAANAPNLALTFRVGNDETFFQLPYLDMCTQQNYGLVKEIDPTEINMSKSKVICLGALPDNTTSAAIVFWYETLEAKEYQQWQSQKRARMMARL